MNIQYKNIICRLELDKYASGDKSIFLVNATTNEYVASPTISLTHLKIFAQKDHVIIQDLHPEKILTEALVRGEVIEPDVVNTYHSGYMVVNEHKLTKKMINKFKKI